MKTTYLYGKLLLKVGALVLVLGLLAACGKTNTTSRKVAGTPFSSVPGVPGIPGLPGTIPGTTVPAGTEAAVAQILQSSGCQQYIQPTTFSKAGNDLRGQYGMTDPSFGAILGNPYVGTNDFRDVIVVRRYGTPTAVAGHSITIYMCVYGDVIVPGRIVDGLYVNELYLGHSTNLAINEVSNASLYIRLSAFGAYPQSQPFLNLFYPVDLNVMP